MISHETLTDEEFDRCLLKANTDWRKRLYKESRRIHYDYESDILHLKFSRPGVTILHWLDGDDEEFEWVVEDDNLHIVGVEIFYFRKRYAPRYPKLQAAYDAMCRDWGSGDWDINLPPQAAAGGRSSAAGLRRRACWNAPETRFQSPISGSRYIFCRNTEANHLKVTPMFPKSVFPDTAQVNADGHLVIGGCTAQALAEEYGTPVYVLDEATIRAKCRAFVSEFSQRAPGAKVAYACKAFINPALARVLAEEGLGFDVVSGGELATIANSGASLDDVYFHGNNKTPQELEEAIAQNIGWVVVDSFHEMELLDHLAGEAGKTQDILLRVSPGIDPHTHVYTTTGILDSKFGFSIQTGHAAQAVRQALAAKHLNLRGLHFHLGSPVFELEPYGVATELVLRFARRVPRGGTAIATFQPRRRVRRGLHPRPAAPVGGRIR